MKLDEAKLKTVYENFKAPFPLDAYQADTSRGFELTTVKAQYIIERLNDCLGFHNWRMDGEFIEEGDKGVRFEGKLVIFLGDYILPNENGEIKSRDNAVHIIPTTGYGAKKKIIGDAYKGARTDALSKAASYLGIANDVFKGLVDSSGKLKEKTKKPTTTANKPSTFQGKKPSKKGDF